MSRPLPAQPRGQRTSNGVTGSLALKSSHNGLPKMRQHFGAFGFAQWVSGLIRVIKQDLSAVMVSWRKRCSMVTVPIRGHEASSQGFAKQCQCLSTISLLLSVRKDFSAPRSSSTFVPSSKALVGEHRAQSLCRAGHDLDSPL
jgi:hypothetical protein